MTTSGTVANTVIDTSAIIEHALRRCRIQPSAQTPETILTATENLYMLLLNLGNRGLNLWCVESVLLGLEAGKAIYTTPKGTLDVLNVVYSQPTLAPTTFSATTNGGLADAGATISLGRVGVTFSAAYTGILTIESFPDNTTLLNVPSASYNIGETYWFALPKMTSARYVAVQGTLAPVSGIKIASSIYDLPVTSWNRDTYSMINDKAKQSRPSTNYFFEKKLTPTVTLWPVPNNSDDHMTLFIHRQPQDVGKLTQQIDIPQRWLDGLIWLLASRLCFELPGVPSELTALLVQMADKQTFEAEQSETDGAAIYITPGIGVYTR